MKLPILQSVVKIRTSLIETAYKASLANAKIQQFVACRKGCDGCCHRMVQLTLAEAIILMDYLKDNGSWKTVLDKVNQYAEEYNFVDRDSWFKMRIPCPVLDINTRQCMAHAVRPVFCSTHFAIGDSGPCDPWYTGEKPYTGFDRTEVVKDFYETVFSSSNPHIFGMMLPVVSALIAAERMQETPDMNFEELVKIL
jgi:Fe-S-cluster containining protein